MTMTYDEAAAHLAGGRNPDSHRRINRNTYVVTTTRGLGIKFHATVIVEFLPDGRYVINTGGWDTVTTKSRIATFAPVRVHRIWKRVKAQPDGLVIEHPSDPTLPVKMQKCRTCKGEGSIHSVCPGFYRNYWQADGTYNGSNPIKTPCSCKDRAEGAMDAHTLSSECWRCKGAGKADYGSQGMPTPFKDGIVVDATGKVVDQMSAPYSTGYSPSTEGKGGWYNNSYGNYTPTYPEVTYTPKHSVGGSTVTTAIRRLVPGVAGATVSCPVKRDGTCSVDDDGILPMVVHLNDKHHWTREQIADWLDALPFDLSFSTINA